MARAIAVAPFRPERGTFFGPDIADAIRSLEIVEAMIGAAEVRLYAGPGAICPDCGELVQHGELVMRFDYDFAGYGIYSRTPVWMHREPCRKDRGVIDKQLNQQDGDGGLLVPREAL